MKTTLYFFIAMLTMMTACGGNLASTEEITAKLDVFNKSVTAYTDCVALDPKNCGGQFDALQVEMEKLSKEINEKIPSDDDWKTNDHFNGKLRKIWAEARISNAEEKIGLMQ